MYNLITTKTTQYFIYRISISNAYGNIMDTCYTLEVTKAHNKKKLTNEETCELGTGDYRNQNPNYFSRKNPMKNISG